MWPALGVEVASPGPLSVPAAGPSFKQRQEHLHAPNLCCAGGAHGPPFQGQAVGSVCSSLAPGPKLAFLQQFCVPPTVLVPLDSARGADLRGCRGLWGAGHTGGLSLHLGPGSCARKAEPPATKMRRRLHVHTLTTRPAGRAPPRLSLSPTLTGLDLGRNRGLHMAGQEAAPPSTQVLPLQAGPAPGTVV